MASEASITWAHDLEPDEDGRWHVYPIPPDGHDIHSTGCDCDPRFTRQCSICDGEGCGTCGDGWIDCGPFEAVIVIHNLCRGFP